MEEGKQFTRPYPSLKSYRKLIVVGEKKNIFLVVLPMIRCPF